MATLLWEHTTRYIHDIISNAINEGTINGTHMHVSSRCLGTHPGVNP